LATHVSKAPSFEQAGFAPVCNTNSTYEQYQQGRYKTSLQVGQRNINFVLAVHQINLRVPLRFTGEARRPRQPRAKPCHNPPKNFPEESSASIGIAILLVSYNLESIYLFSRDAHGCRLSKLLVLR
jgi:hypothetical protein